MLKLVLQVFVNFFSYIKAKRVKVSKLFLLPFLSVFVIAGFLYLTTDSILALQGDYSKDLDNNTLSTSEWNLLETDFVTRSGDTMIGNLNIFKSSGDNSELQLESNSGLHWGIYNDRTTNDLRFWRGGNLFNFTDAGNFGIATTTPQAKLHVIGAVKMSNLDGSYRVPSFETELVPKKYVDDNFVASTGSSDLFFVQGGNTFGDTATLGTTDSYNLDFITASTTRMTIDSSGNIGIGTTNPGSLLTITNNNWISSVNSSDTGYVNMFKINSNNQLEIGASINSGTFEFAPDSGLNTFVDMAVTSAPAAGTIEGYVMKMDGNNILSVYSEANGSGGIQNEAVGIGTAMPSSKLTVEDGDFEMTNNKSIKIEDAATNTTLLVGNYADGSGFSYGTNYTASLAVEGDIKGDRICIEEDCKATWADIVSVGSSSFVGLTTTLYNGSQGGYVLANDVCANEYADSHICTVQEILYTVNNGGDDAIAVGTKAWVSAGPPGYTANANDCQGWNSASASDYGKIWIKLAADDSFGSLYKCNDTAQFMCCK